MFKIFSLMVVGLIFGLIGIAMLIAGIVLVSQCRQAYYYYSSYYCNVNAFITKFEEKKIRIKTGD